MKFNFLSKVQTLLDEFAKKKVLNLGLKFLSSNFFYKILENKVISTVDVMIIASKNIVVEWAEPES